MMYDGNEKITRSDK